MVDVLSDLDLVALEADTYQAAPRGEVVDVGCDRAVLTRFPGWTLVSIAGTRNLAGWLSDFEFWDATLIDHAQLGPLEAGFAEGADAVWQKVMPLLGREPLVIQGHSRGGGMVPIITGMALFAGFRVIRCVVYEGPWSVGRDCRDYILRDHAVPGVTYWNGNDPVPTEPDMTDLVPNVWPIRRIGKARLIAINCHYIEAVQAAMNAEVAHA